MIPPVVLSPTADQEFVEAAAWYERRAGLGDAFIDRVQEALDRIGRTPELHAPVHKQLRRARVERFPYGVYYRVQADRIEVIAVIHDKRDPRIWRSRA